MRARITYHRGGDLVKDADQQFARGGVLLRGQPQASLAPEAEVTLEIATPYGKFALSARVLQVLPGAGVALAFAGGPAALAELEPALARARREPQPPQPVAAADPEHTWLADVAAEREGAPSGSAFQKIKEANKAEKMQMALHGAKAERAAVLRDHDKTLHPFVLRNPGLQIDEVAAIARMSTVAPELLKLIADRREWAQRPEIAAALVRNPKTPAPIATKLIDFIAPAELRQLAKTAKLRGPVLAAVRRKVVGP